MSNRKGEPERTYFRSDRLENINGKWFFKVREHEGLLGPYQNSQAAQQAFDDYVNDTGYASLDRIETLSDQYIAHNFFRR